MAEWLPPLLTGVFAAHLAAFVVLAVRRGGVYYWLVTALFTVLTAAFAMRWLAPEAAVGGRPWHLWLRYAAWVLAALTLPQLAWRLLGRWRGRGRVSAE